MQLVPRPHVTLVSLLSLAQQLTSIESLKNVKEESKKSTSDVVVLSLKKNIRNFVSFHRRVPHPQPPSLTDENFKSDILYLGASQIMSNFFMRIYLKLSCQISIHHIYPVVLSISCLIKDCYHHIITYLQHQNIIFHSYCLQVTIELISRLSFNCDDMQLIIVDNLEIL